MSKGQTATEYLIILAVVIIIALIVVGVMGGIPGIGPKQNQTQNQTPIVKDCCHAQFNGTGAYMPNPASVYCSCIGGESILKNDSAGNQYSNCDVNGTETEEWTLYRNECNITAPIQNTTINITNSS